MIKMIILLGTSHISPESIRKIREAIKREKPDCVAVELDRSRYVAMVSGRGRKPRGIFLRMVSWMQKEMGKMTGIVPGEEMLEAVEFSRKSGIRVYLIDQDFSRTVRDLQKVSSSEKIRLFLGAILGAFAGKKIDLKKVPPKKMVKEALAYLKSKFPRIYRAIVVKRDEHMAIALKEISKRHKKVLAVVGAGHIDGMKKLLKDEKLKIIG